MRVLVTGHRGKVGRAVTRQLEALGHRIVGFDRADGDDLLDADRVAKAAAGCDAVAHLAALPHDSAGTPRDIMAVNVLGTWHVLLAAEAAGAGRVVACSSTQALGVSEGEHLPDYFPIDDLHPRRAMRPYGLSKRLGEDLCAGFTARTGIPTISLRPVLVCEDADYPRLDARRRDDPASEFQPFWEYGSFVDVRDVAAAVGLALEAPWRGHHRALLCAWETIGSAPSLELAARLTPGVPVRDPGRYAADPWRSLVDCSVAERVLGWRPAHGWPGHLARR